MGWPPMERWGGDTGVAWVSFSAPSMRRARGLRAGAAGPAWGSGLERVRPLWVGRCAGLACLGSEAVG